MISPLLNGLTIRLLDKLISRPYSQMTISAMREWGIEVMQMDEQNYTIPPGQHYRKDRYVVEGDYSSAGYFFAIAALTQSTVTLNNLNPHSAQADRKLVTILERMGNGVTQLVMA